MNDGQNPLYDRVDHVLDNLRRVIRDERSVTHGDPGLFAHVFMGMVRPYVHGVLSSGRGLQDLDGYTFMTMMKLARQAVGGPVPFYDHALDGAGYQVLRAAHLWEEPKDLNAPGNRTGEQLLASMKGKYGTTFSIDDKIEIPDNWTTEERARFIGAYHADAFLRFMAKEEANGNPGLPPAYWDPNKRPDPGPGQTTRQPNGDPPEVWMPPPPKHDWQPPVELPEAAEPPPGAAPVDNSPVEPEPEPGRQDKGPVDLDALAGSIEQVPEAIGKKQRPMLGVKPFPRDNSFDGRKAKQ